MILDLICHACARACEYEVAGDELHSGGINPPVYIIRRGETIACGHCGRVHLTGWEMKIAAPAPAGGRVADQVDEGTDANIGELVAEVAARDNGMASTDRLVAAIRRTPLVERLQDADRIVCDVVRNCRPFKMSIPASPDDEDLRVTQALYDATTRILELEHENEGLRASLRLSRAARIEADQRAREAADQVAAANQSWATAYRSAMERAEIAAVERDQSRAAMTDTMKALSNFRRVGESAADAIRRLCEEVAWVREGKGEHVQA